MDGEHQDLQPGERRARRRRPATIDTVVGPNARISGAQTSAAQRVGHPHQLLEPAADHRRARTTSAAAAARRSSTRPTAARPGARPRCRSSPATPSTPTRRSTGPPTAPPGRRRSASTRPATQLRMRAYKSIDGGATWTFDATFSGAQTAGRQADDVGRPQRRPRRSRTTSTSIWHNGAAGLRQPPHRAGRLVGHAAPGQRLRSRPARRSARDIKTNAFGDVFAFWPTTGNRRILSSKSTNGGVELRHAVQSSRTTFDRFDIGVPAFNNRRALIYVSAGAYRTAARTWSTRPGPTSPATTGCTHRRNEPGSNVTSTARRASGSRARPTAARAGRRR